MAKTLSPLTQQFETSITFLGRGLTLLFPFCIVVGRGPSRAIELTLPLLTLVSIYLSNHPSRAIFSRLFGVMLLFFLYMTAVNSWAESVPSFAELNHAKFSKYYIKLFLFVCIGWWLKDHQKLVPVLLVSLIIAFCLKTLIKGYGYEALLDASSISGRYSFGFSNAQHSALFASAVILVSVPLMCGQFLKNSEARPFLVLFLVLASLWAAYVLYVSKTRGVYLGLLCTVLFFTIWLILNLPNQRHRGLSKLLILTVGVGAIVTMASTETFIKRFQNEQAVIANLLQQDLSELRASSISVRLNQWAFGLDKISERPMTGYGGASKVRLIEQSDMPDYAVTHFGHFHNSYIEVAVAYGLIGLAVIMAVFSWQLWFGIKKMRTSSISGENYFNISIYAVLIIFLVANLFESYVMYRSGYILFSIFGGIILSAMLNAHLSNKPSPSP